MLTIHTAIERGVIHRLGGEPSPQLDPLSILNYAGAWLFAARPWQFLRRRIGYGNIASGRDWVELPQDCVEVFDIVPNGPSVLGARLVTYDEIRDWRARNTQWVANDYMLAPYHQPDDDQIGSPLKLRLEIYPTPQTSEAKGILLHYRGGWVQLLNTMDQDRTAIQLPVEIPVLEPLYVETVGQFALGMQRPEAYDLQKGLTSLRTGPLFAAAERLDQTQIAKSAPLKNTALETANMRVPMRKRIWTIPDLTA